MKYPDSPEEKAEMVRKMDQGFSAFIPHNAALGLRFVDYSLGKATMVLPYAEHLVGNPETGVLHGGPITSLMDACCGCSVFMRLGGAGRIATLDLRIDYLRPARKGCDVTALADCYKLTRNIAFTRGIAHDGDESDPVISASGTFVVFSEEQRDSAIGKNE
jgi:uncharacterized protein (TIGR00369 family)